MKKYRILLLFLSALAFACSPRLTQSKFIGGTTYESKRGDIYQESRFTFNVDSTFTFIGNGPSIFLSKGYWQFDLHNKEIVLKSKQPDAKFKNPKSVDTLWVDLSHKRIKIKSKKELLFEDLAYFRK